MRFYFLILILLVWGINVVSCVDLSGLMTDNASTSVNSMILDVSNCLLKPPDDIKHDVIKVCDWAYDCFYDASIIPFVTSYFCHIYPITFAKVGSDYISLNLNLVLYGLLYFFVCVVIFFTCGMVADIYLSSLMVRISELIGLPDYVAGSTVLAFGNAASDIILGILGVLSDDVGFDIFVGDVVGAAFFVSTIVFGSVIIFSHVDNIIISIQFFLKEIFFLWVAILYMLLFQKNGIVSLYAICCPLLLYFIYVILTFFQSKKIKSKHCSIVISCVDSLENDKKVTSFNDSNFVSKTTLGVTRVSGTSILSQSYKISHGISVNRSVKRTLVYLCNSPTKNNNLLVGPDIESSNSSSISEISQCDKNHDYETHTKNDKKINSVQLLALPSSFYNSRKPSFGKLMYVASSTSDFLSKTSSILSLEDNEHFPNDKIQGCNTNGEVINLLNNNTENKSVIFDYLKIIFSFPILFIWRYTIPAPIFEFQYFLFQPIGISLFILFHQRLIRHFSLSLFVIIFSVFLSIAIYFFSGIVKTYFDNRINGGRKVIHNLLHWLYIVLGIVMAIYWNSALVCELLECVKVIGLILNISHTKLGLTLVAVGNSIADLFANVAISRAGHPLMGLSGCFGAGVFLILFGFGSSILLKSFQNKFALPIIVTLSSSTISTVYQLLVYLPLLALTVCLTSGNLSRKIGYFSILYFSIGISYTLFNCNS